jgi:hypothetical protein
MRLTGWSVRFGEPDHEAQVQVATDDGPRDYRYLPQAREKLDIVEFTPKAGARELAACRLWLEAR